jgi:hypothetical protein
MYWVDYVISLIVQGKQVEDSLPVRTTAIYPIHCLYLEATPYHVNQFPLLCFLNFHVTPQITLVSKSILTKEVNHQLISSVIQRCQPAIIADMNPRSLSKSHLARTTLSISGRPFQHEPMHYPMQRRTPFPVLLIPGVYTLEPGGAPPVVRVMCTCQILPQKSRPLRKSP